MKISVAICTYNRSDILPQCLEHLISSDIPENIDWELLLIDNNSTDKTATIAKEYATKLPIKYFSETSQGLSFARNRAIDEACGDYLIFLDDDAFVSPKWLKAYCNGFKRWHNAPFWGGRIIPHFTSPPPEWLKTNIHIVSIAYAIFDLGEECFVFPNNKSPFGANFAVNLRLLNNIRFNTKLGRIGSGLLAGEETELLNKVKENHGPGVYLGNATVRHSITAARTTKRYIWNYYMGHGRTSIMMNNLPPGIMLFSVPGWLILKFCSSIGATVLWSACGDKTNWLQNFQMAAQLYGMIQECRNKYKNG